MSEDSVQINRRAWEQRVKAKHRYTQPIGGPVTVQEARLAVDPLGWIDWSEINSVLCVAAGGGNWSPHFATIGCKTTVVDFSPGQLATDRGIARALELEVETVEADVLHLDQLHGRNFDLLWMAVSDVYFPNMRKVYSELARVIKPGGYFYANLWNPVWMQIPDENAWDGAAYRLTFESQEGHGIECEEPEIQSKTIQFIHPLGDLFGGLCDAGFAIRKFSEEKSAAKEAAPGTYEHMARYVAPFFRVFSQFQK